MLTVSDGSARPLPRIEQRLTSEWSRRAQANDLRATHVRVRSRQTPQLQTGRSHTQSLGELSIFETTEALNFSRVVKAIRPARKCVQGKEVAMAKLVFGMNQSL